MEIQPDKNSVIEKDAVLEHALDFNFLRTKGIELIQKYSGKNWSDFNLHDPGVTILEYVCYALTDVGYRTTFPITDILADKKGEINREQNFFFPKEEVLSSGPVTVNDYRKLLIDSVPEVDDIWIEPIKSQFSSSYSKGVYNVIIKPAATFTERFSTSPEPAGNEHFDHLIQKVQAILMAKRNIGDNYEGFQVLKPQEVYLKAEIVIEKNVSPSQVLVAIYDTLERTISPAVSYYTEAQLLTKGYKIEDIYTGPLLEKGILPDHELHKRITSIDPFDLIKAISGLTGVISIKKLELSADGKEYRKGMLKFDHGYYPVMRMDDLHPDITLYHDTYNLYIRRIDVLKNEQKIKRQLTGAGVPKKQIPILLGQYKNLKDYVSIQTLFPAIYGIGEEGTFSASPASIAKSRQLKAYLMLFEQLIADSLAQLSQIGELFSTDDISDSTYFFQPLYQVPDAKYILKAFTDKNNPSNNADWENFKNNPANEFIRNVSQFLETDEQYKDRKKRALEHMLSRFNIAVHIHPVFLYELYYDRENHVNRNDLEIQWKSSILNNLAVFTSDRVKADNYMVPEAEEDGKSGFEKKMSLLLHIQHNVRFKLSKITEKYKDQLSLTASAKHPGNSEEETVLNWRDEELSILSNLNELEIDIKDHSSLTSNLTFRRQSEKLFKSAIVLKNYRIVSYPSVNSETTVILYKQPAKNKEQEVDKWSMISKHKDDYEALIALKKTVNFFKEFSMDSEGFYIVEHLLLKPAFDSKQYGFTFAGENGQILIKQLGWHSFSRREAIITALFGLSKSYTNNGYAITLNKLKELCVFKKPLLAESDQQDDEPQPDEDAVKCLMDNLKQFDLNNAEFFPSFNYTVKRNDGQEIAEDYYNFRMTVVFPSWPARFQDDSFGKLASQLFMEECPAHIKVSFCWLSFSQMIVFDKLYFEWRDNLSANTASEATHIAAQEVSKFLMARELKDTAS
ncbi:hypothetical protein H7F33_05255 [Pedobacter sp. PAMC26386]|nr:hypothetical protein H7F33_05255 [Pedobacter sp. PAMC26386]